MLKTQISYGQCYQMRIKEFSEFTSIVVHILFPWVK